MTQPSFDTWTIIFMFAAIQGLFLSIVLLTKKNRHISRIILAAITAAFSTILIEYVLYWTGYQFYYPYLVAFAVPLYYLFGPLFFLYFKSIFNKSGLSRIDLVHFLPFVLVFAWYCPFLFKSVCEKQYIFSHKQPDHHLMMTFMIWANVIQMCGYFCLISVNYWSLSLSNPEVKKWFQWLLGSFVGFIVAFVSYYILINFSFFYIAWDYGISFAMLFFIFLLASFGYIQPKVFQGFTMFDNEKVKYKNSPISPAIGKEIINDLEKSMSEKKYFLQSDLSLEKLSEHIGTNKHYLSQAINENLQMNFFEYINSLRIKEALELLGSKDNLTIIEIAYQIGYNNKVSFNKAFKNIVGQTPSEYKKTL